MTKRYLHWIVFGVFAVYVAASPFHFPATAGSAVDLDAFGRLPVSVNGRVQPVGSVARLALVRIRESVSVPVDGSEASKAGQSSLDATEWMLEALADADAADARRIFPVTQPELLARLSLGHGGARGRRHFSFTDVRGKVEEIGRETQRIASIKDADRKPWESELLTLRARLVLYERLKNSVQPNSFFQRDAKGASSPFEFARELGAYRAGLHDAVRIAAARREGRTEVLDVATEQRIRAFARLFQGASRIGLIDAVPPRRLDSKARWKNVGTAIVDSSRDGQLPQAVVQLAAIASAYTRRDAAGFNAAVAAYERWLVSNGLEREASRASDEAFYNRLQLPVRASALYAIGLVLICAGWALRREPVVRSGSLVVVLAFLVHSAGFTYALALGGRPSVFGLAAWATALVALVLERRRVRGVGVAAAATVALVALVLGHASAFGGLRGFVQQALDSWLLAAIALAAAVVTLGSVRRRSHDASPTAPHMSYAADLAGRRSLSVE